MSTGDIGPPKSRLHRHRLLAPTASVMVSPICLGAMNFGDAWKGMLGECDKDTSFKIMDFFYDMGGNFIDTYVIGLSVSLSVANISSASNYQAEQSEQWVGEWMKRRGNRDEMVIATKYVGTWKSHSEPERLQSNYGGSGTKNMRMTVDASLKKLQTDYIDLWYVHVWDYTTSIPELMHSLNQLVLAGKVLYLGISDTPAWVVSKCNEYARQNGLRQFSVYQGWWNAAKRDFERDIIPMCKYEGMALAPWGTLGSGNFKPVGSKKEGGRTFTFTSTSNDEKVSAVLETIANKYKYPITSVALAYVMHKAPYVFPICGGRKVEHLKGNIEALGLELSPEDVDEIEKAYPFDIGFPNNFLAMNGAKGAFGPESVSIANARGHFDWVIDGAPIRPHKE